MSARTATLGATFLVAMLAASCASSPGSGGESASTSSVRPTTTTAPPKAFSTAELQAMLLTSSEVPSRLNQQRTDTSDRSNSTSICGISGSHYLSTPGQSWASVSYVSGDFGGFVVESLDGFPSIAAAQDSIAKTKANLEGCNGRTDAGAGMTATYAVTPEDTNVGGVDEQMAFHIVVDAKIITADGHLVITRKGTVVSSMFGASLNSSEGGSGVSTSELSDFVNAAVAKIG